VLVKEQTTHHEYANQGQLAQTENSHQAYQQEQHDRVERSCYPKGMPDSPMARNRMQAAFAIKIVILARVEHIETANPERDGGGKQQDARIE